MRSGIWMASFVLAGSLLFGAAGAEDLVQGGIADAGTALAAEEVALEVSRPNTRTGTGTGPSASGTVVTTFNGSDSGIQELIGTGRFSMAGQITASTQAVDVYFLILSPLVPLYVKMEANALGVMEPTLKIGEYRTPDGVSLIPVVEPMYANETVASSSFSLFDLPSIDRSTFVPGPYSWVGIMTQPNADWTDSSKWISHNISTAFLGMSGSGSLSRAAAGRETAGVWSGGGYTLELDASGEILSLEGGDVESFLVGGLAPVADGTLRGTLTYKSLATGGAVTVAVTAAVEGDALTLTIAPGIVARADGVEVTLQRVE